MKASAGETDRSGVGGSSDAAGSAVGVDLRFVGGASSAGARGDTVALAGGTIVRGEPVTRSPACTVYYDGACPVCSREIAHYRRQTGSESIAWVDASSCDEAELGAGLERSVVLGRFHVREADGTLTSGAAAFVAVWRHLPAFAWLAALASSRPALALLEAGYSIFLRVRPRWRRLERSR